MSTTIHKKKKYPREGSAQWNIKTVSFLHKVGSANPWTREKQKAHS